MSEFELHDIPWSGALNIKTPFYQYMDSRYKNKTAYDRLTFIMEILIPGNAISILRRGPGGRLNKKDGLTRYGNSHVKDKTS